MIPYEKTPYFPEVATCFIETSFSEDGELKEFLSWQMSTIVRVKEDGVWKEVIHRRNYEIPLHHGTNVLNHIKLTYPEELNRFLRECYTSIFLRMGYYGADKGISVPASENQIEEWERVGKNVLTLGAHAVGHPFGNGPVKDEES